MSDNKTLEARIGALEMKIKFMEARMTSDMSSMMELFSSPVISAEVVAENNKEAAGIELAEFRIQLSKMTPKQHVALQMVIGLCENSQSGRRKGEQCEDVCKECECETWTSVSRGCKRESQTFT